MTFPHHRHRNAVDIEQFHTHCLKLFFLPHSRMGASTSQVTPDEIDEATAKELAGVYWDQRKFEAAKNEQGCISREQFEEEALAIHDRVRSKYCEVSEVFKKSLWEPLIMTSFYDILYNEEFGSFAKYDKADTTTRRILLLESFRLSEINPMTLRCDLSCDLLFHKGTVCTGSVTVTGAARDTEDKALTSTLSTEGQKEEEQKREGEEEGEGGEQRGRGGGGGGGKAESLWADFSTTDPDEIAVHLWTFSMSNRSGGPTSQPAQSAFYRRVNMACLQDDRETLLKMSFIICGIIRWINRHSATVKKRTCLYRGTPIQKEQEVDLGDALAARSSSSAAAAQQTLTETHEASRHMCRMPLFVAVSESLTKAQEFCWINVHGIACPILEFVVEADSVCESLALVQPLSHFPDEREWLIQPYAPYRYLSQRLEFLEISEQRVLKCVMVVSYEVLSHSRTLHHFERHGHVPYRDSKLTRLLQESLGGKAKTCSLS